MGPAAIDAGADLILGHHAHILKGIEVYKGKVIFYSLCNFVMPNKSGGKSAAKDTYSIKDDPEYPNYTFPVDSRKTIVAKCVIANKKINRVSFLPTMVTPPARPVILDRKDKRFDEVLAYMQKVTTDGGLNASYKVDGDEVVVLPQ